MTGHVRPESSVILSGIRTKDPDISGTLLTRNKTYLERLLPSLLVIRKGLGVSLDELVDGSEHRLTPQHLRKIDELQRALGF